MKKKEPFHRKVMPLRYALREKWLSLRSPTVATQVCPVCGGGRSMEIRYGPANLPSGRSTDLEEEKAHSKYRCHRCGHLYSHWLDGEVDRVGEVYDGFYGELVKVENVRAGYQLGLHRYLLALFGHSARASLLDFGCGPNVSPTWTLRKEGHDVRCCDIQNYPYDGEIYFRHDIRATRWDGYFDGLISIDVIEHLGNTVETFAYFNRVLKRGGYMAHCFPSQFHYKRNHTYFQNPYHVCLFSPKSLKLICRKTGFALRKVESFEADVPHLFLFQKVREL